MPVKKKVKKLNSYILHLHLHTHTVNFEVVFVALTPLFNILSEAGATY